MVPIFDTPETDRLAGPAMAVVKEKTSTSLGCLCGVVGKAAAQECEGSSQRATVRWEAVHQDWAAQVGVAATKKSQRPPHTHTPT